MYLYIDHLPPKSKIWFFYDDKPWDAVISMKVSEELITFCEQLTAHDMDVPCSFRIIDKQIIIFAADTIKTNVTGCAIDNLIHFMQEIGEKHNINLFTRNILTYLDNKNDNQSLEFLKSYTSNGLKEDLISTQKQNIDKIYILDTTISTLEYIKKIKKKVTESWLMEKIPI